MKSMRSLPRTQFQLLLLTLLIRTRKRKKPLSRRNYEWATKLVSLNGGTKVKPLPGNIDNEGYDGTMRFFGTPEWNDLPWSVDILRDLVSAYCEKHGLDEVEVVPDGAAFSPKEAVARAKLMRRKRS